MRSAFILFCGIGLFLGCIARPAASQNSAQTQRAFVPAVEVLGRGDASAALPGRGHPLTYNPAHIAALPTRLTAIRLQGAGSGHVSDHFRLVSRGPIGEALNGDLDAFEGDLSVLADSIRRVGTRPALLEATVALPSFVYRRGPYAVSAAATVHSLLSQRFRTSDTALPRTDHTARTDIALTGAFGYDASAHIRGLHLGLSVNAVQRYVSLLEKPIDEIGPGDKLPVVASTPLLDKLTFFDNRPRTNPVWVGRSVSMDVGALYVVPASFLPGTLQIGAAAFDLGASAFTFTLQDTAPRIPLLGPLLPDQTAPVRNDNPPAPDTLPASRAARFQVDPSVRVGVAYTLDAWGPFRNLAVAVDYQDYRRPPVEQSALAHLHVGAEAQYDILIARLGINQGYPTAGVGLRMGHIGIDYAFYGREEGASFRETYNYINTLQMTLQF